MRTSVTGRTTTSVRSKSKEVKHEFLKRSSSSLLGRSFTSATKHNTSTMGAKVKKYTAKVQSKSSIPAQIHDKKEPLKELQATEPENDYMKETAQKVVDL